MEDSDNILLNGTGTPYVAIFDSKKNPIIDSVSGLPIGELVSSFTYVYDEESESYYCDVNLDEDEYYRFISTEYKECPYYRNGDEYRVVRHQM